MTVQRGCGPRILPINVGGEGGTTSVAERQLEVVREYVAIFIEVINDEKSQQTDDRDKHAITTFISGQCTLNTFG